MGCCSRRFLVLAIVAVAMISSVMAYGEFTICVSDYPSLLLEDINTGYERMVEDGTIDTRTCVPPHAGVVLGAHGTTQLFINSYVDHVLAVSSQDIERAVYSIALKCCAKGDRCAGGYMSLDDGDNNPVAVIGIEPVGGYGSPEDDLQMLDCNVSNSRQSYEETLQSID